MMQSFLSFCLFFCLSAILNAQVNETFPYNGVRPRDVTAVAFIHATVFLDYQTKVEDAVLIVRNGRVEACGAEIPIPADAVVRDVSGMFIYPSFIDLYSDYGLEKPVSRERKPGPQIETTRKGAFGWNESLKPDIRAVELFSHRQDAAKEFRAMGFGSVLTHQMDGIARGTGALVALGSDENLNLLIPDAAAHYSFSKGSSHQDYPSSLMGSIALLRQTYYDADWYENGGDQQGKILSLEAWNTIRPLPQIFEANDKWNILRADKIGDEFGVQYIIKSSGDEYQRIDDIKATKSSLIVPLNFPQAYDVSDPNMSRLVSLTEMKHWEMAPANAAALAKANISFAFSMNGLTEKNDFLKNLRKSIASGLSETDALRALTYTPAMLVHADKSIGSLKNGFWANFILCDKSVFSDDAVIHENWVQGEPFITREKSEVSIGGNYKLIFSEYDLTLKVNGRSGNYKTTANGVRRLEVISAGKTTLVADTLNFGVKLNQDGHYVSMVLTPDSSHSSTGIIRLAGYYDGGLMGGRGELPSGDSFEWTTGAIPPSATETLKSKEEEKERAPLPAIGNVIYPFCAYGYESPPQQETILIKNATVWTCDEAGVIENGQVLISAGKIVAVGGTVDASAYSGVKIIDATGKHVSPGIIDEHSHIALMSVNEGAQASSAEVKESSVIWPEDINIYRQLSGGVTAAQLLHGSANPIGGQSALIKLRWGKSADQMLADGAPGFIKFALGENVKQSNWGDLNTKRFPQTRMGVEQVFYDHFIRAGEYGEQWKKYNVKVPGNQKNASTLSVPRRDLELDALLEILEKKRFVTCHSYVQSEINMLMHVADSMNFTLNTFTHILEGYKVADKMKDHGAGASTFSDWWGYKLEVQDAIPYNGALMWENGLVVAFNSDDPEMARRLNQEVGKAVKYGGVPEEEALKFVTINPAKLLHVDKQMGSVTEGKDADIVIWSDNPLSIYARAEKTFVDGICYYDHDKEQQQAEMISNERARLMQKMLDAKKSGEPVQTPKPKEKLHFHCDTIGNLELNGGHDE